MTRKQYHFLPVEDDPGIRMALSLMISNCCPNSHISEFSSACEAMSWIQPNSHIDLAIVDFFTQSQYDGYDLVLSLRESFKNLPIISISGSSPTEFRRLHELVSMPDVMFLRKPFKDTELNDAIKMVSFCA